MSFKEIKGTRHEIKLLMPYAEYLSLAAKLSPLLSRDTNAQGDGDYFIRSLYLDDIHDTAYVTKIAGADNRTKYRIRCYNCESGVIKFECKHKYNNRIKKVSFGITEDEFYDYLNGNYDFLEKKNHPLAKDVLVQTLSKGLKPAVIVDYSREAYIHPLSDTRLTFDKHLRAAVGSYDIFDRDIYTSPIFENDSVIFEVKYNDYIPAFLTDIIATAGGVKMSLSKYCMCRSKKEALQIYK